MSRKRHTPADEPHFLVRTLAADFGDGDAVAPHAHSWGQLIYAATGVVTVWTEQGCGSFRHPGRSGRQQASSTACASPGPRRCGRSTCAPSISVLAQEHGRDRVAATTRADSARRTRADARCAGSAASSARRSHRARMLAVASAPARSAVAAQRSIAQGRRRSGKSSRRPCQPRRLARRFGVGVRTLERGFVAETGLSLGEWRRQARFMEALRQLGAGSSVKRAAMEAGYRTPSAFIAAFRSSFRTTPGRYFRRASAVGRDTL